MKQKNIFHGFTKLCFILAQGQRCEAHSKNRAYKNGLLIELANHYIMQRAHGLPFYTLLPLLPLSLVGRVGKITRFIKYRYFSFNVILCYLL